ncbi:MAG: ATP-dependent Clp protease proteolytic subunit [Afipia sp.]|jgi:phage major head subunit gpT-like protein|nr:MAG: ATP-dependent Clp protease proteolytic subunit [Afipia sp.]
MNKFKFMAAAFAIACGVAVVLSLTATDASAAPMFGAHLFGDHSSVAYVANAALLGLRNDHAALVQRAKDKIAEITEGMTPEAIRSIETDHADLVRQTNEVAEKIRVEEARSATPPAPADATRAAVEAERARVSEITALSVRHAMPADFATGHINSGTSLDAVRVAVLDAVATRAAGTQISGRVRVITDEGDVTRDALEVAILHRANPSAVKITDAAREWRGMSLMEMGRTFYEQTTGNKLRGLGKMELASRLLNLDTGLRGGGMLSTSDFPNILANVVAKRLRNAYEVAPQNWKKLARQSNAPDFKSRAVMQLSNLPNLKKIREGGEYSHAALADSKEQYALATYGRIVSITRQTLINDDMGAFDRLPMLLGRAAAETEAGLFWAIITANAAMGDGVALFHANHGNLGTAGPIATASLNEGRSSMRKQKGLAPKGSEDAEPLNLAPKFIVVGPDKETEAQQFLATTLFPSAPSNVNVFAGSLEPIVEARLTGNAWYLFADPALIDTIEYAYLEGEEGLFTEQRLGFEVDGLEIKGRLDFAAKAIDFRGMFKNAGN